MRKVKIVFMCLTVISLLLSCTIFSFAYGFVSDPVRVDSSMSYPVPSVSRTGLMETYTQYYVNQIFYNSLSPRTTLYRIIFTIPHTEDVILRLDGNQKVCINTTYNESISYRITSYDVESGRVLDDLYRTSSAEPDYLLSGYSQVLYFRAGYLVLEEGIYGSSDAFGYPISDIKRTSSSSGDTPDHAWNTDASPYVSWNKESYSVVQFINQIFGLPDRYIFIAYIVGGVLILILLDGIINFLFGSISDLTSRRRQ